MIGVVVDADLERHVEGIVFSDSLAHGVDVASPWEKLLAVLVERYCHDSIGNIECLFDPISMMHIHIQIKNSLMVFQELKNSQDNVIRVAETTGLAFFGMMEASSPVNCDVGVLVQQYVS